MAAAAPGALAPGDVHAGRAHAGADARQAEGEAIDAYGAGEDICGVKLFGTDFLECREVIMSNLVGIFGTGIKVVRLTDFEFLFVHELMTSCLS